jgi:hypothetical protein
MERWVLQLFCACLASMLSDTTHDGFSLTTLLVLEGKTE